jgi:predicted ABC-type ATPase
MSVQFVASCTILGGTNGSGKSTIYEEAVRPQIEGEFVNADILARRISPEAPEAASLRAGKQVVVRLDELITKRQNFVHETTLSSRQSLRVIRRARAAGYQVGLIFVVLHSVELNILRVRERVRMGANHRQGYSAPIRSSACEPARSHKGCPSDRGLRQQFDVARKADRNL